MKTKFFSCVQCRDAASGKVGTFIAQEGHRAVSPIFGGLVELYVWMRTNGWRCMEGGHPWEVEQIDTKTGKRED